MACLCDYKELNAQMAAMQARVDNLDKNLKEQMMLQIATLITHILSLAQGVTTLPAAIAAMAQPLFIQMLVGYVSREAYDAIMDAMAALANLNAPSFPGLPDIPNLPSPDFLTELFATLSIEQACLPPFPLALVSSMLSSIEMQIAAVEQLIAEATDPAVIAMLQAQLEQLTTLGDQTTCMFDLVGAIAEGEVQSHLFGEGPVWPVRPE